MLQDIAPLALDIEYLNRKAEDNDYLVVCNGNRVLIQEDRESLFPVIADARRHYEINTDRLIYLFDISGKRFFLSPGILPETGNLIYHNIRSLRERQPKWLCFAAATAMHLAVWYDHHRYCGKCAHPMVQKEEERALHCPQCGLVVYPRINPVVIVGLTDGNRLLLTKNANQEYTNYALISGFMEISEALEDTVKREVREEVGLAVKNMRYYKSQPWAFSESMLIGIFAEVDGDTEPILDGKELTEATWFEREDLPADNSRFSLTWDMIESFRRGEV